MSTIYEAIGGEEALVQVVDDLYQRVLSDTELAGFFAGSNMSRLKGRQVEFFTAALGGPTPYRGVSMKDAHRGKGILRKHFDLVVGHLVESLRAAEAPQSIVDQILAALAPLADDIVSPESSAA